MVSLYRKWRSRSFDDLFGQQHVVRTLQNAVRQQRVAHAYLFTGPRGTGKTSTARILAKAVNCLNPHNGNPCNECEMCRAANEGRAMDVIEIDAASNTSVDNVRDLRERVAYAAGEGRYKVYIVDEVHRLSAAAFDAFLKTLEEPPPHVIFVFASTEPHKVPETILSRCQRFDFRRIPLEDALERLRFVADQEELVIGDQALRLLALHAHGSLRDALGLLDQAVAYSQGEVRDADVRAALGLADADIITRLGNALVAGDVGSGLAAFHAFLHDGGDPHQLTRQFVDYWRALLLVVTGVADVEDTVDPALAETVSRQSGALTVRQVLAVLHAMLDQDVASKSNLPPQLPFEMAYVRAALTFTEAQAVIPVEQRQPLVPVTIEGPPVARPATPKPAEQPGAQVTDRPVDIVVPLPAPPPAEDNGDAALPPVEPGGSHLDARWPTIVANMRSRSPSLQAVLRSGHIIRAQDGEITIGFLYDFHRSQFTDPKKRKLLEEVIGEVLGVPYRVNCVRTTREEVAALRGPEALDEDDGFVEEVAERLREFHAKQLGNGRS